MSEYIIKASAILLTALIFVGLLAIRYHDCVGAYCPSL